MWHLFCKNYWDFSQCRTGLNHSTNSYKPYSSFLGPFLHSSCVAHPAGGKHGFLQAGSCLLCFIALRQVVSVHVSYPHCCLSYMHSFKLIHKNEVLWLLWPPREVAVHFHSFALLSFPPHCFHGASYVQSDSHCVNEVLASYLCLSLLAFMRCTISSSGFESSSSWCSR